MDRLRWHDFLPRELEARRGDIQGSSRARRGMERPCERQQVYAWREVLGLEVVFVLVLLHVHDVVFLNIRRRGQERNVGGLFSVRTAGCRWKSLVAEQRDTQHPSITIEPTERGRP